MAKKKTSMSAKIRNLLDKGLEPKKIAKRLKIAPAYVHTIKWAWANDIAKKVVEVPAVEALPVAPVAPSVNEFDMAVRKIIFNRIEELVLARVDKVMESL